MASEIASVPQVAHSASLLSAVQIKVGDPIPDVKVKESSPQDSLSLADLPGKNIIVRRLHVSMRA